MRANRPSLWFTVALGLILPASLPGQVPDWATDKPRLHADELAKKVEGGYFTGTPLADIDPDTGWGFGARGYYYWNDTRSDPFFAITPYRHRVYVQAFVTNKGFHDDRLDYEWLYAANSPWRLRTALVLGANGAANYFGVGSDAMRPLTSPRDGLTFGRYADYLTDLRRVDGGRTWASYNQFSYVNPAIRNKIERELLGGRLRLAGGFEVGYVRVRESSGQSVDADGPDGSSTTAIANSTKLNEDCAAHRVIGCGGGWNNSLKFSVAWDTRDFEPDPNDGLFVDLVTEIGTRVLGSDFAWQRVTFSPRGYWSPFPQFADLVLAGRLAFNFQTSGTPFFSMDSLSQSSENVQGLGGSRTLRGFRLDRFVGPVATLANAEVRWTFFETRLLAQRFAFAVAPFVDTGRVYDNLSQVTWRGWRVSGGGGLRIAWNQATVGAFDLGASSEGVLFYTEFGHPF